jgi:hypothetical protein
MELEFTGHEKQMEAAGYWLDRISEEILFGGAKNGGKSFLGCSLIFADALIYPETSYFIARRELNDLRKFTIPTVHEVFHKWKIDVTKYAKYNGQDNCFKCYNDSIVYFLECKHTPSDPYFERFGSMQMTRGMIEEANETESMAYQNLKLSLGRKNNDKYGLLKKLLLTCNPKKNYLYRDFYKPFKAGTLAQNKKFIQSLVTDNVFAQSGAVETLDAIQDNITRLRLRYGEWEYDDEPGKLIEFSKLIDLFDNRGAEAGRRCITIDVARKGRDKSVIVVWDGWRAIEIITMAKNRINELASTVDGLRKKHNINKTDICADEDGVGGGLVDILDCVGFINGSSPVEVASSKENFSNLRSQCIYKFCQKVNENGVHIETGSTEVKEAITEELDAIKLKDVDKDGKLQIIGREEFIKLIGRSPDYLSALMQRVYIDIGRHNMIKSWRMIRKH